MRQIIRNGNQVGVLSNFSLRLSNLILFSAYVLVFLFFLFCFVVSLANFRSYPLYCWYVGLVSSFVSLLLGIFSKRCSIFFLGFFTCILPFFGTGELNCSIIGFLFGIKIRQLIKMSHVKNKTKNENQISIRARLYTICQDALKSHYVTIFLLPFFAIYLFSVLNTFVNYSNSQILIDIFNSAGVNALYRYLSVNSVLEFRAITEFVNVCLGLCIAIQISKMKNKAYCILRIFASGLACGLLVSLVVAIGQILSCRILDIHPFFNLNFL